MVRRLALAALAAFACWQPALGQDRQPAGRQALVDLAFVLGQSHALRQACQGEADQYWRSRMLRLIDVEAPDEALKARLIQSFTTGFNGVRTSFPTCSPAARQEASKLALRGRALSDSLASP